MPTAPAHLPANPHRRLSQLPVRRADGGSVFLGILLPLSKMGRPSEKANSCTSSHWFAMLILALATIGARAAPGRSTEAALARVDSLCALHQEPAADSLVRAHLARLPLATADDSSHALPWLVRRYELLSEFGPIDGAESTDVSRARLLADRLETRVASGDPVAARLLVASARLELFGIHLNIGVGRHARLVLDATRTSPGPEPKTRWAASLVLLRLHTALSSYDSAHVDLEAARAAMREPWARAEDRALTDGLGAALRARTDARGALRPLEEALAVLDSRLQPIDSYLIGLHSQRAATLAELGYPFESLQELQRIVRVLEDAGRTRDIRYAVLLEQIGARQRRLGQITAARETGERSVEAMRRAVGEQHEDYAFANWILSQSLRDLGDLETAKELTERAVAVFSERFGTKYLAWGEVLSSLGVLQRRMGYLDSARTTLERAVALQITNSRSDAVGVQLPRTNLANVLGELGEFARAAAMNDSAVGYLVAARGTDHPITLSALAVSAQAYRALSDTARARSLFDTLVVRRLRKYGPLHTEFTDALHERGFYRALTGDRTGALEDALQAATLRRRQRRVLLRGLDERAALATLSRSDWGGVDLALTELTRGVPHAEELDRTFDQIVRDRALLFDELLSRRRDGARDPAISQLHDQLTALRADMARRLLSSDDRAASAIDSLARREATIVFALETGAGSRRDSVASGEDVGAAEVRSALPVGSALVSFVRFEALALGADARRWAPARKPAYAVFVTRAGEPHPVLIPLGDAGTLDSLVSRWLRAVAGGVDARTEHTSLAAGRALRIRLLDGVRGKLRGVREAYVVFDGSLGLCDPGALPDAQGGYLLEGALRWHRLSSERQLTERAKVPGPESHGLLALGGADFDRAPAASSPPPRDSRRPLERFTDCEGLRIRRFRALPASRLEAEHVCETWRRYVTDSHDSTQLLVGPEAGELAFRTLAPGHRSLHLATHGFALHDDCDAWNPAAAAVFRTLYRSGLALAGANSRNAASRPEDDGLLTAGEISTLDLRGTNWVCLSACESGLGEPVRGEGLLGLERAFRLAGVQQVVISLWPVADETAAHWNDAFYRAALGRGLSTDEAARTASLQLLQARRLAGLATPPASWGCFVVSGRPGTR